MAQLVTEKRQVPLLIAKDRLHEIPSVLVIAKQVATSMQFIDVPLKIVNDARRHVPNRQIVQSGKPHGKRSRLDAGVPLDEQFADTTGVLLVDLCNAKDHGEQYVVRLARPRPGKP
jgi:hypothetical protein